MPRARNATPQRDDNHVQTDDEIADLQHEGQEENIAKLGRAQTILDARAAAQANPEGDEGEEEEEPEFDPAAEARALRKSGFMDTTAPDEDDDSEHVQAAAEPAAA